MVPTPGDQDSLSDAVEELYVIVDAIPNLKAALVTIELWHYARPRMPNKLSRS